MEIKKNRFNGNLGHSPLFFDRKSCRYSELPMVDDIVGKKGTSGPATSTQPKPDADDHWNKFFSNPGNGKTTST